MSLTLEGTRCDGCGKIEEHPEYGEDAWTSTGWPLKQDEAFDGVEVDLCLDCDEPTGEKYQ